MPEYKPKEVNEAFAAICPGELTSKFAVYPIPPPYNEKWLAPRGTFNGDPVFIASQKDQGIKEDYIWCKCGTLGRGYYHILTKIAYNNLYTRLSAEGPGTCCGCFGDLKHADQWDTTRRIVYNRCRANRPDDVAGAEQAIDHMTDINPNPIVPLGSGVGL